jgi:ATP-dependent RNA helicase DDX27
MCFFFARQQEKERLSVKPVVAKPAATKRKRGDDDEDRFSDLEDNVNYRKQKQRKFDAKNKPKKDEKKPGKKVSVDEESPAGWKAKKDAAKDRTMRELESASLVRAKLMKSHRKPKRLHAYVDPEPTDAGKKKAPVKTSMFARDLYDTSAKGVKRLRYEANKTQKFKAMGKKKPGDKKAATQSGPKKISSTKLKNKAGQNKFNKGKHFGAPKASKKPKK